MWEEPHDVQRKIDVSPSERSNELGVFQEVERVASHALPAQGDTCFSSVVLSWSGLLLMARYLAPSSLVSWVVGAVLLIPLFAHPGTQGLELQPSSEPAAPGALCWEQIQQEYYSEKSNSSGGPFIFSECAQCCDRIILKAKQLDWIRLSTCGSKTLTCFLRFPDISDRLTQDIFWLTSSGDDVLLYMGNSSQVVVNWDYLTGGQKLLEIVFLFLGVVVLMTTCAGNTLVLATMLSSPDRSDPWWIVRTSLAIADLLCGVFVMGLALHNCQCLMTNHLRFSELEHSLGDLGFHDGLFNPLFVRRGYSSFCGIVFAVTSVMSMQCLGWLALERFMLCKYPLENKILTSARVKLAVLIMWIISLVFPLIIVSTGELPWCSFFDPVTKLTFVVPKDTRFRASHVAFVILSVYLAGLFLFTVIASLQAMTIFRIRSREELDEVIGNIPLFLAKQQEKEDRSILRTMRLMLVTYLVSVVPQVFLFIPGLKTHVRFLYFIFWWTFVLSSSWNWYIYNMRSTFFKAHLIKMVLRSPWLPQFLETRLRMRIPLASTLTLDWGSVWHELDAVIKKKEHRPIS
ncbi:uncharacterized protein [Procambarus clarkii]|uniref:uncharacterized protein isoform X1 n=2 Tax=Procambarus clarkii TaxID=6728 RepID=UPI003743D405